MEQDIPKDRSIAQIMEDKQKRREQLYEALRQASSAELEHAAKRWKEVMRKRDDDGKRRRIAPPSFSKD